MTLNAGKLQISSDKVFGVSKRKNMDWTKKSRTALSTSYHNYDSVL